MAKIQLVIEIEEQLYKNIIDNDKDDEEFEAMDVAFCDAKPLPKDATNGDVIRAIVNPYRIIERPYFVTVYVTEKDFNNGYCHLSIDEDW